MKKTAVFSLCFAFSLVFPGLQNAFAQAKGEVQIEWLSWSHYRFTSPGGKVILTNPHLDNPDSRTRLEDLSKVDYILVPDGHRDEIGKAPEIAARTGAKIVTVGELAVGYLTKVAKVPAKQLVLAGIGDRFNFDGITVRLVHSIHGSGVPDPSAPYGGPAAGFIITFENGLTVYHSGSTALHSDLALYGSLYKPDIAIIILSANRDPRDAAHMVRLLRTDNPNLKVVFPHHHRVKPAPGAATPEAMEAEIRKLDLPVQFIKPELGKVYTFTKSP
ncbi:MAG: MBL fold metallo-hydrolase [Betaproteobacteria bacterium]|nr:MBL fold metallo-hydrolase [Betaproteobacteria bacterium]